MTHIPQPLSISAGVRTPPVKYKLTMWSLFQMLGKPVRKNFQQPIVSSSRMTQSISLQSMVKLISKRVMGMRLPGYLRIKPIGALMSVNRLM